MHVLIAPDSFKESLTAAEAAGAMAEGVRRARAEATVDLCPVADGGEGTTEALVAATGGRMLEASVTGPLGEPCAARWGLIDEGRTAVIEMAQAAGLDRVPRDRRDPTRTTTYGVGELMRHALDAGVSRIILGIGGSATTDGGCGMAQALGAVFEGGVRPMVGGALLEVRGVDRGPMDSRLKSIDLVVACDVDNPLTGPQGAAAVYGPQKGATPQQVRQLDAGLKHLAKLMPDADPDEPGAGAAGGLGYGLRAFCGATMRRGIDLVLEAVRFDERVQGADLVLTGEGRLDGQSLRGKTCLGVAQAAARHGVPTVALVGSTGPDVQRTLEHGLHAYHAVCDGSVSVEDAMAHAATHLSDLAGRVMAAWPSPTR